MDINDRIAPSILQNRLALVTGAGQGNGAAIARGLARAGAAVIVTDINAETAARTAAEIERAGGRAWSYTLDVASSADCVALAARTAREAGRIDLLVNNAGILIREGIDHPQAVANLQRTLEVWLADLRATRGCIVNVASIAAFAAHQGMVGYSPSKGAIKMLTQTLAGELAADGIRVNAIAPGVIATAMSATTRANPERLARFMQRIPLARVAEPEELIGPVVFLASEMASYITGATLPVDGGFLAI